ncbi:LacI family transcriptional regulator CcpA [Clostridium sediminicola]|uniref:LacI family DNA-binding transcriptional regulator n=1 Tax=Clostridium sediminicola TaxID=3114879 RepID=UPI0031F234C5
MKITINEVAIKAGVSTATVSRVLNGQIGYSEKTKEKVLKAIKELNYSPNAMARSLASNTTSTIGVLVPYIPTSIASTILYGLETVAGDKGYSVIISNTGQDGERTTKSLDLMSEKRVDGIIIISEPIKEEYYEILKNMKIPSVLVSTMSNEYLMPYVKVDDRAAAYSATQFLIEAGHNKIAMISGYKDDLIAGTPRIEGYINAHKDYGITIDDSLIKYGDFSYKSGVKCMEELISEGIAEEKNKFTAVFAASDYMAVGALKAAYINNIKVPEDISIIGYDNTEVSQMAIPSITVVAQPFEEMGRKASDNLIAMIEGKIKAENSIMQHYLIERESVKRLK